MATTGFRILSSVSVESCFPLPVSSMTRLDGDALELDVGAVNWTVADAGTQNWQVKAICAEPITSGTVVLAHLILPGMMLQAESANASDVLLNGDRMLLTDTNTVNNAGSDNTSEEACFIQIGTVGATTDNQLKGFLVYGNGIDTDAS